jgi:heat shock protein HslJ
MSMKYCNSRSMRLMAVAAVTAMLLTGCGSDSNGAASSGPPLATGSHITAAGGGDPTSMRLKRGDLIGTWRPLVLFGHAVRHGGKIGNRRLTVRFHSNSRLGWTGYDGCNWTTGPFHVGGSGAFSAKAIVSTAVGCIPLRREWTDNVTAITRADRVAVSDGMLTVYGPGGQRIGIYERMT